ncbi:hypothetical protein C8Q79DRAFT_24383 [Trametes meyenii]|nr:hypothetical protein C8Q79DRAFT_24383 [Trametes meyenii]
MSPFLPHHTHAHHPRLMDGVRRWMGTNPTTGSRNSRADRVQDQKSKKPYSATESLPETLPELVMKLLDPVVTDAEEDEYQQARSGSPRHFERRDIPPQIYIREIRQRGQRCTRGRRACRAL